MNGSWIRGSRCNVDNCRTHYYQLIDGQRICQFGHVYEGHFEFNDDEDEPTVVTKRLKIPGSGETKSSSIQGGRSKDNRIYGQKGYSVYMASFQCILRTQVHTLINKEGLPKVLEPVVRRLWCDFTSKSIMYNLTAAQIDYNPETEGEETDTGLGPLYDKPLKVRKLPRMMDAVSLLYIAFRYLSLPVYITDIIRWINNDTIPYISASHAIPYKLRAKLTLPRFRLLKPNSNPSLDALTKNIIGIMTEMDLLDDITFNYEPLLIRMMNQLILPPRIYHAVPRLAEILGSDLSSFSSTELKFRTFKRAVLPDIKLTAMVLLSVKLFFYLPASNQGPGSDSRAFATVYKWRHALNVSKQNRSHQTQFDHFLATVMETDEKAYNQVLNWSDKETEQYLDWYQQTQFDGDKEDGTELSLPLKRLRSLFDLPESTGHQTRQNFTKNTTEAFAKLFHSNYAEVSSSDGNPLTMEQLCEIDHIFQKHLYPQFGPENNLIETSLKALEDNFRKYVNSS